VKKGERNYHDRRSLQKELQKSQKHTKAKRRTNERQRASSEKEETESKRRVELTAKLLQVENDPSVEGESVHPLEDGGKVLHGLDGEGGVNLTSGGDLEGPGRKKRGERKVRDGGRRRGRKGRGLTRWRPVGFRRRIR